MKKDFKTIKNIILLIASALTLVAVTFSWYSLDKKVGNMSFASNVSGSTIDAKYYESKDGGSTYTLLNGDMEMKNMGDLEKAYYRMDVRTFSDKLVKIVMSFDGLSSNKVTQHVYFDYRIVSKETGAELESGTGLKMSNYTSNSVFAVDVSGYQKNGNYNFYVYYDVYVNADGADVSGEASLGEVKLLGQQIS